MDLVKLKAKREGCEAELQVLKATQNRFYFSPHEEIGKLTKKISELRGTIELIQEQIQNLEGEQYV